jgi:hypothetical protein
MPLLLIQVSPRALPLLAPARTCSPWMLYYQIASVAQADLEMLTCLWPHYLI